MLHFLSMCLGHMTLETRIKSCCEIAHATLKIVATAKDVGVLPPEAPQWPNSSSGGCANHVPGDVRWLHKGRLHDVRRRPTTTDDGKSGLLRWGTPT